jgi:periplasmic copper chaperone A
VSPTSDPAPAPAGTRPRRGSGVPAGFLAALVAVVLGVGGLVVGARDQADSATAGNPAAAPSLTGTTVGNLTVTDAYIRQPASPDVAAAYLSVRNDGDTPDRLSSAYCGAATTTTVHSDSAAMVAGQNAPATPLAVPAKSVASLTPAKGHIMLDKLTGTLKAGDTVSLLLRFDKAGQVLIDVPVIAITAPAPGGATS